MKAQSHFSKTILLFATSLLFCLNSLSAQSDFFCNHPDNEGILETTPPPPPNQFSLTGAIQGAPKISAAVFPTDHRGGVYYHKVAGFKDSENDKIQISLQTWLTNLESSGIRWTKTEMSYVQNGVTKTASFVHDSLPISKNGKNVFQNGRGYHQVGDVIYLEKPFPTEITLKFYFFGYSKPQVVTRKLRAYSRGFAMPFKASDLKKEELFEAGSTHGGGGQVFGYDFGLSAYVDGKWTSRVPAAKNKADKDLKNEDIRIWGKPVYAMADGVVTHFVNDCPNNVYRPKMTDLVSSDHFSNYPHGGAGNHFFIAHSGVTALYAHFQKGSLNPKLMQVGAVVKKGEFLGLVGNSGNSGGPHLHISLTEGEVVDEGQFLPLQFNTGWVLGKHLFPKLETKSFWKSMSTTLGLPGYEGQRAFLYPGASKPTY